MFVLIAVNIRARIEVSELIYSKSEKIKKQRVEEVHVKL